MRTPTIRYRKQVTVRRDGCSCLDFCEAVDRNWGLLNTLAMKQGHSGGASDVVMDFVLVMLRTQRWRDHKHAMGTVDQFVVDWFKRHLMWFRGWSSRRRTEWKHRRTMPTQVATRTAFDDGEASERLSRALAYLPEEYRVVLVTDARLGRRRAAAELGMSSARLGAKVKLAREMAQWHLAAPRSVR